MYNRFRLHQFHFDPVCFFYRKLFEQFPIYTYTGICSFFISFSSHHTVFILYSEGSFFSGLQIQISSFLPANSISKRCLSILIILLRHQCRRDHQISKISSDPKYLCDHGQHIPACSTGKICIQSSSLIIKIFRNSRIHPAVLKIHAASRSVSRTLCPSFA